MVLVVLSKEKDTSNWHCNDDNFKLLIVDVSEFFVFFLSLKEFYTKVMLML